MIPRTFWTIGGRPVPLRDFSANSIANGGFDQMRGVLPDADARRFPHIDQGAKVKGFTSKGRLFWEGEITAFPTLERGVALVAAQGAMVRAIKQTGRLLFQSRDFSDLTPAMGNPHNYVLDENKYHVDAGNGRLLFSIDAQTYLTPEANGVVFWAPGSPSGITRIAFSWRQHQASNHQLLIQRSIGPSGGLTNVQTVGLGAATSGTVETGEVLTAPANDQWAILIQCAANHTPPVQYVQVTDLRINGITSSDTYYASQAVSQIGSILGYDVAGVLSSTLNILPFDWKEGAWVEALSYIGGVEDRYWRVVDDDLLEYEPWGTNEYRGYQSDGVVVDLVPMEVFNQVTVHYRDVGGAERQVTKTCSDIGITDPLAGTGQTRVWEESLADVQADSALATKVASLILVQKATRQYAGGLAAVRFYDRFGREATHDVRGGDAVRIMDFKDAPVLRVSEAAYGPNGVNVGIAEPAGAVSLIGRDALDRARMPVSPELPVLLPEEEEGLEGGDAEPAADRAAWLREQYGARPLQPGFEQPRYDHSHMHGPGRHHGRDHSSAHRHFHKE